MRKVLALFMVLAALLSLCACGNKEKAASNPQTVQEAKSAEAVSETESKEENESVSPNDTNEEIRPEIKEAIDSYEAFVDEYCAFMNEYTISDLSKLSTYNELLQKEVEMTENFEALENEELTPEEAVYYSEVSVRCAQKMLEVAADILK